MPCIQVLCPTTTAGASATKLYFNFYVDLFHMLGFKRDGEPPPLSVVGFLWYLLFILGLGFV